MWTWKQCNVIQFLCRSLPLLYVMRVWDIIKYQSTQFPLYLCMFHTFFSLHHRNANKDTLFRDAGSDGSNCDTRVAAQLKIMACILSSSSACDCMEFKIIYVSIKTRDECSKICVEGLLITIMKRALLLIHFHRAALIFIRTDTKLFKKERKHKNSWMLRSPEYSLAINQDLSSMYSTSSAFYSQSYIHK